MTTTDSVMCDGCLLPTWEPVDCQHGKTPCQDCADFALCHLCQREARFE